MPGKRIFQIIDVSTRNKKIKSKKGGKYISSSPSGAAKKVFTRECRLSKIKGQCTLIVKIQDMDSKKIFKYKMKRLVAKNPVERMINGKKVVYKYETIVRSMRQEKECDDIKCDGKKGCNLRKRKRKCHNDAYKAGLKKKNNSVLELIADAIIPDMPSLDDLIPDFLKAPKAISPPKKSAPKAIKAPKKSAQKAIKAPKKSAKKAISPPKPAHEILGIQKNASQEEIKQSYKKLAIKYHPDKHIKSPLVNTEKFKELQLAYDALRK
jgi:DnaJ-domain-containing protein 1